MGIWTLGWGGAAQRGERVGAEHDLEKHPLEERRKVLSLDSPGERQKETHDAPETGHSCLPLPVRQPATLAGLPGGGRDGGRSHVEEAGAVC